METVTLNQSEKHALVIDYTRSYGVFIETGLWSGNGVSTTLSTLQLGVVCYAIDLERRNVEQAAARGVRALQGDSTNVLPLLLRNIAGPACFWLDAHYSPEVEGDAWNRMHPCPLLAELEAILAWPHAAASTVLVDDVRLLGCPGWPTRADLFELLADCPWLVEERDDILRLAPIP